MSPFDTPDVRVAFDDLATIFRALGNPLRLHVLSVLSDDQTRSTAQLAAEVSVDRATTINALSPHLVRLAEEGMITVRSTAAHRGVLARYYGITERGLAVWKALT